MNDLPDAENRNPLKPLFQRAFGSIQKGSHFSPGILPIINMASPK